MKDLDYLSRRVLDELSRMESDESVYRDLYRNSPDLYQMPIQSWLEFSNCYNQKSSNLICPVDPPTIVDPYFDEKKWFPTPSTHFAILKHFRYCPPFWHRLGFVKLACVLRGSAELFYEDQKIVLKQGEMCIVSPNTKNAFFSHEDDDIAINLILRESHLENILASLLVEHNEISAFFWEMMYAKRKSHIMLLSPAYENDVMRDLLHLCGEMFFQENPNTLISNSYLNLILGKMLRYYRLTKTDCQSAGEKMERFPLIIQYIHDFSSTITLPELAQHFNVSESYMSRYIKKETGETFSNMLRIFRMKKGAELLKNSNASIEEIVDAIGYTDVSRFYRNFKEMYGMTPNSYREHC